MNFLPTNKKVKSDPPIRDHVNNPTFNDLVHLKRWVYDYNLFVHPAVFKAMKLRERFIAYGTALVIVLLMLVISLFSLLFDYLTGVI